MKPVDLSNFTILTGVNGSGKTQLLEAISSNLISVDGTLSNNDKNALFRLFDWNNLTPNNSDTAIGSQLVKELSSYWHIFRKRLEDYKKLLNGRSHLIDQKDLIEIIGQDAAGTFSMSQDELQSKIGNGALASEIYNMIRQNRENYNGDVDSNFSQNRVPYMQMIDHLKENLQKPVLDIDENDFYGSIIIATSPSDIFQQSFSRLFVAYEKMRIDNKFNKYLHEQGEEISFLTDDDFVKRYGDPPWEFLNSVLESSNLDFRVTKPTRVREEVPYQAKLIHQRSGDELVFSDLSSGEKILMSFTLCLYYAEDKRQIVQYPQVLLFDEIDAPLHPSMTQSLLDTIQSTLVGKHGRKVIMTTHSPSTVALAPEDSVYIMEKDGYERIKKISRDGALALLTTGVPTLSIDYENRRQVFVESKYDVAYYEKLYNFCRSHLEPKISLTFIASGFGKQGNCNQVEHIVNGLANGGNRNAYGVIDWDTRNQGNLHVKVLGKGKRYSIENYLLEPIFIALLLLKDSKINGSHLGLDAQENYRSISSKIDSELLHVMTNFVASEFLKKYPTADSSTLNCQYIGGYSVKVPNWYLKHQGHELEEMLKLVFPSLNQYHKESALKMAVLDKVLLEFPELLSVDFVELFKEIQNYQKQ